MKKNSMKDTETENEKKSISLFAIYTNYIKNIVLTLQLLLQLVLLPRQCQISVSVSSFRFLEALSNAKVYFYFLENAEIPNEASFGLW